MKNVLMFICVFVLIYWFMLIGLKALDYELEQNEIKNRQWVQDIKDGKPYTNKD